jgi:hypothetical protein
MVQFGRVRWVSVAILAALAGCGGGDDGGAAAASSAAGLGSTVAVVDSTDSTDSSPTTAAASAEDTTGSGDAPAGPLPDACTLLSSASVASAIGGTPAPSQPQKPNEISSRCIWSPGAAHSLNLDVRAGSNAETTFNNTIVGGFTQVSFAPAEGWIMLGARESDRNYRLVIFEAYDGTYYIHLSLQGPDRDDAAATQVATALASEVYAVL